MKFSIYSVVVCTSVILVLNPVVVSSVTSVGMAQALYLIVFDLVFVFIIVFNILHIKTHHSRYLSMSVLLFVGLPFVMVLTEATLAYARLFELPSANIVIQDVHRPDPILGWTLISNTKGRHVSPGNYDAIYYVDGNHRKAIPQNSRVDRTLHFFGDSFIFGLGVSNQNTALNLLAKEFSAQANVLNYGVMGYNLEQMFMSFRSNMNNIKVGDFVIFTPLSGDLERNYYFNDIFYCLIQYDVGRLPAFREGQWVFLLKDKCSFLKTLLANSYGLPLGTVYRLYKKVGARYAIIDNANKIFGQAAQLARQRGAEFLVIFLPTPAECRKRAFNVDLEGLKTPFLSLMPHCPTEDSVLEELKYPTDPHWSSFGNEWAAHALEKLLRTKLEPIR